MKGGLNVSKVKEIICVSMPPPFRLFTIKPGIPKIQQLVGAKDNCGLVAPI